MNLEKLSKLSDSYTDEALTKNQVLYYANKAIAVINSRLRTELPLFVDNTTDYEALNETWMMYLILPYINYSIKMNDSSLTEAARYESEFWSAFTDFESQFTDLLDADYLVNVKGNIFKGSARNSNSGWFHGAQ